jgi:hypothetical protein
MSANGHPPTGPAWDRLQDQLRWYDAKSARQKRWFHRLKVSQIVIAAAIPVVAAGDLPVIVAGALGAVIVVLEGLQQLFQFHESWLTYRATAEALKHEQHLFLAGAGPYAGHARPAALLAERVEGLVSQEHASWTQVQHTDAAAGGGQHVTA